jgi:prepilin-type N-terminal cleavage/methylation domain-containing protein/prepilin-type processing-associated H-X9-DG protein
MVIAPTAAGPRRGFTLIELLVVIAIIAILAAILMPVFAKVREKGRQTSCTSNNKEIATAVMMYAQDYDNITPYVKDAFGFTWWGGVQAYVQNAQVFRCPSNTPIPGQQTPTDYLFNGIFSHGRKLRQIQTPAEQIMLAERLNTDDDVDYHCFYTLGPYFTANAATEPAINVLTSVEPARHSGGSVYAFADGHVKWQLFADTCNPDGLNKAANVNVYPTMHNRDNVPSP